MTDPLERLTIPAGTTLFAKGERGASAFIIEQGSVEIWVERNGERVTIARRGAGDIVGEMAIVDDGPRSASATATSDCVLLEITAAQFRHRTQAMDPVMRTCLGVMLERFRATLELIEKSKTRSDALSKIRPARTNQAALLERLRFELEIDHGLEHGQFALHYQPIVDLADHRVVGYEALIRWNHPRRGLIPPAEFIAVAEECGAIGRLTRWVVETAAGELAQLRNCAEQDPVFVSLNVSAANLNDHAFADGIMALTAAARADPAAIKLEITEDALVSDPDHALATLTQLRKAGFGIAVDDFGTGYSSLGYLAKLPICTLKIDRSFVTGIGQDPAREKIVRTILLLAREFGLTVVAEGVETAAEEEFLKAMGCRYAQGFLYARPMPLAEVPAFLAAWTGSEDAAAVAG